MFTSLLINDAAGISNVFVRMLQQQAKAGQVRLLSLMNQELNAELATPHVHLGIT